MTTPKLAPEAADIRLGSTGAGVGQVRHVLVDGVAWAVLERHEHGPRGQSYTFRQVGGQTIRHLPTDDDTPAHQMTAYTVHSQGRAQEIERFRADDQGRTYAPPAPLQQRLVEMARELMAAGRLRHPDVQAAENKARRDTIAADQADGIARARAEFEHRARQALQTAAIKAEVDLSEDLVANLVNEIVDAMKWAQSR